MSNRYSCPNCGFELKAQALFCPKCGSDENTGWSEDTIYDDIGLPDASQNEAKKKSVIKQDLIYLIMIILFLSMLYVSLRIF
ncbi:MAG: zinc-ribbon domain-containing protein [Planctomycetes bacterium]|nr:zinc-ribbon domain-containing protein [Planctomycetota bacterium]